VQVRDSFSKALVAGLDKLWKGQEETCQLLIDLITKANSQHNMEQDDVADLVQVKDAHVYFNITKVEQGNGNKLQLEFIKQVEEKEKPLNQCEELDWQELHSSGMVVGSVWF
jgi:hypothetical protein